MGDVEGVCGPSIVAVESTEEPYEMEEPGERDREVWGNGEEEETRRTPRRSIFEDDLEISKGRPR